MLTVKQIRESIDPILQRVMREHFVASYHPSKAEAMGVLSAKYFSWDGDEVLKSCAYGLEDANFHREAGIVADLIAAKG